MRSKDRAPSGLSREAARLWRELREVYDLDNDPAKLEILNRALESFDRMRAAQAVLKVEGMSTTDKYRGARVHPAVAIERDASKAYIAALKALRLWTRGAKKPHDVGIREADGSVFDIREKLRERRGN